MGSARARPTRISTGTSASLPKRWPRGSSERIICEARDRFEPRRTKGADTMTVKVAINGFGRIGRNILRAIVESGRTDIQVVAINDLGPVETNAHLLRYDSIHGRFPAEVKVDRK